MSRLLRAGFHRLFKSRLYGLGLLIGMALGIFMPVLRYWDIRKNREVYEALGNEYRSAEGFVFSLVLYMIFVLVIWLGNFVGAEYSDGTMRSKIISGHKRWEIYLSNYIVCAFAGVSMQVVSMVFLLLAGRILLPYHALTVTGLLAGMASQCLSLLGFTAVMLIFTMLIQSKATASVLILGLTMVMLMTAMTIFNLLDEKEYIETYDGAVTVSQETGEITGEKKLVKNPRYVEGRKRTVYEALHTVLPVNQFLRILNNSFEDEKAVLEMIRQMAVCSVATIILVNGAGIWIFQKMDLK